MAYARNYATGTIETEGIKAYAMRARAARAGRIYAINEGSLQTTGERAHGMSVAGYTAMRAETVLPPDTTDLDLLYAANTGTIVTRSREGERYRHSALSRRHGDRREQRHDRGPRRPRVGILAASHGAESSVEDCTLTYAGQPVTDPETQCARTYRGGDVTVINQGDISASGTNHRGQGTGIGISAKSDGGDVVIRSSGNISASAVGIRAETSTEGTITIKVTGTLDAPIPAGGHRRQCGQPHRDAADSTGQERRRARRGRRGQGAGAGGRAAAPRSNIRHRRTRGAPGRCR